MIQRRKDRTQLIAETWLPLEHHTPHGVRVYLWANLSAMRENTPVADGSSAAVSGRSGGSVGSWNPIPWTSNSHRARDNIPKTIGELHFVRGYCGMEMLAHEIAHLQIHLIRVLGGLMPFGDMFSEEKVCYSIGCVANQINKFLYKHQAYRDSDATQAE